MHLNRLLFCTLLLLAAPCALAQAPALPYKAHAVTTPDGVKLNVQEWGNPAGPEILLIHGFAQSYLSWGKQFGGEMAKTFRMVTYDARGHGFSDKPLTAEYYKENQRWADEVKAVIEQTGLKRPVLVGWSYAGRIMLDYLMTYGDAAIAGVNFVDAVTNGPLNAKAPAGPIAGGMISEDLQKNVDATRAFLRACFSKQPSADEFEQMLGFNMLVPSIVRRHMLGRPTPYEATLKALKVPVLVTHGIEDKAVLREVGQYTAATVPGARLSEYPGIGHAPFWEEPVRFNRELAEFVQASNRR